MELIGYLRNKMAYELLEEQPETSSSIPQEIGRHASRTASNLGTLAIGFPGDVFSLVNEFIAKPATEFITGEKGSSYEETPLGKLLPTTETHRERLRSQFGENLKPQNKIEKFADDIVEDTVMLLSPSKLIQKGAKKIQQL